MRRILFMKKFLGFAAGAAVIVAVAVFFITQNPALFNRVINWVFQSLGM
jgi:hypothetical protein